MERNQGSNPPKEELNLRSSWQTDDPKDASLTDTTNVESISSSLSSKGLEEIESLVEHEKYHPSLKAVIDQIQSQKTILIEDARELRLAKCWLVYTNQVATEQLPKLNRRQVALSSFVKETLLKSMDANRDLKLLKKFTAIEDKSSNDNTALNAYLGAYNVLLSVNTKLLPMATNGTLNEWTLMTDTIVELVKTYVTTYCKSLFDIEYDKTIEGGATRPDVKIFLDATHTLPLLVCEVSTEAMNRRHITVAHKDGMKLSTSMQQLLCQQLQRVPIEKAGMFGLLVGQFGIRLVFMRAIYKDDLWAFPMNEVIIAIDLRQPIAYQDFFKVMATIEEFAKEVRQAVQDQIEELQFPVFPTNPERGRRSANSSTPRSQPSKKSNDKKENKGNNSERSRSSSFKQRNLPNLEGELQNITRLEKNSYTALWNHGSESTDVFIIRKTANDAREIQILKEMKCRTIIKLLHAEINSRDDDEVTYTLVMPIVQLEDFVPYGLINHLTFARDILEAMVHIHSMHIVHRDIKPNNVGRDASGTWLLFDFNNATQLLEEKDFKSFTKGVGTEDYMAPEVKNVDPELGYVTIPSRYKVT